MHVSNRDDAASPNVIIDGDLTADGDLTVDCEAGTTGFFVLVTGTLRARNVFLSGVPKLIVRGDLIVTNGLQGRLGEGSGYLEVYGVTTARIVVNTTYFRMRFRGPVQAVVAGDADFTSCSVDYPTETDFNNALRPGLRDDRVDLRDNAITEALRDGRPILRQTVAPRHLTALAELDVLLGRAADVTEIDLSHRNLRAVPERLADFRHLRRLSLAGNELIRELPDSIGDLGRLEELDVAGTGLTGLPPAIGRLTSLRVLDISGNNFRSLPDEIGDLRSLTVLRATGLTCPVPAGLARLSALEELALRLDADGPGVEFPTVVTRLPRLRALSLHSSVLASVPDDLLALTTLEELDLGGALGYVRKLPDLSRLPRLCVLRMSGDGPYSMRYPDIRLLDGVWDVTTLEELEIDQWGTRTEYDARSEGR